MNKTRRKEVKQACSYLEQALSILETVRDDEQESADNAPENGRHTEQIIENADRLDSIVSEIQDSIEYLGEM